MNRDKVDNCKLFSVHSEKQTKSYIKIRRGFDFFFKKEENT